MDTSSLKGLPFCELLPALRGFKCISQNELAELLNSTQATVSRYERGANLPKAKIISKLSQIFEVDISLILESIRTQTKKDVCQGGPVAAAAVPFGEIPIKGAVSAGTTYDLYPEDLGTIFEKLGRSNFKSCFTVVVKGDSMQGRFHVIPDGALAVIDSNVIKDKSLIGKVVCARLDGEEHVLKELVQHNGKMFLKSWNEQYPLIEVTPNTTIEGVLLCLVQPANSL